MISLVDPSDKDADESHESEPKFSEQDSVVLLLNDTDEAASQISIIPTRSKPPATHGNFMMLLEKIGW
jgi:hypothetical protein